MVVNDDRTIFMSKIKKKKKNGSVITIGKTNSLKIKVDHHFNWFQKKMIELCFGFKVENYD